MMKFDVITGKPEVGRYIVVSKVGEDSDSMTLIGRPGEWHVWNTYPEEERAFKVAQMLVDDHGAEDVAIWREGAIEVASCFEPMLRHLTEDKKIKDAR